jgi:hypothetical protein
MSEETEDDATKWFYDRKEEDWDMFDQKMTRHMVKNYDEFGERLWFGHVKDFNGMEFHEYIYTALKCGGRLMSRTQRKRSSYGIPHLDFGLWNGKESG